MSRKPRPRCRRSTLSAETRAHAATACDTCFFTCCMRQLPSSENYAPHRITSHIPLNVAQPSSAAPALTSLRVCPLFSPRGIYSGPQRSEFKPLRVAYAWLSFSVCPSWLGFLVFRVSKLRHIEVLKS